MYFVIRLAQHLDTPNVVDGRWIATSDVAVEESHDLVCVDPADYPLIFRLPRNELELPTLGGYIFELIRGYSNEPLYTWDPATRTFNPYSGFETDSQILAYRRREESIQPDLLYTVKPGTEFKKIRRALAAIVEALPELKALPEVQEFLKYSEYVNTVIGKHPK